MQDTTLLKSNIIKILKVYMSKPYLFRSYTPLDNKDCSKHDVRYCIGLVTSSNKLHIYYYNDGVVTVYIRNSIIVPDSVRFNAKDEFEDFLFKDNGDEFKTFLYLQGILI